MKLKTLIIDDEPIALEKLKSYVERVPFLELAGMCSDGLDALKFLNSNEVQLIITDINMPDLDGLEFIKSLPSPPLVIFSTAYPEFAVDSYKVSAVDYLLKPYGFAEFSKAVNKILERNSINDIPTTNADESFFIKVDYRFVRVNLSQILYIKGYGEYLQIFVEGKSSPIVTLSSFASIKEKLTKDFLQVHRSYIVNMNKVDLVDRKRIFINKDTEIPVGDSYRTLLQEYINNNSIGKK